MATLSFAQNGSPTKQVSIQSNGVIVHESAGNEGFASPVYAHFPEMRTIESWTLPECIEALRAIDEKMTVPGNTEEDRAGQERYLAQRALIEQRKQYLIAQSY